MQIKVDQFENVTINKSRSLIILGYKKWAERFSPVQKASCLKQCSLYVLDMVFVSENSSENFSFLFHCTSTQPVGKNHSHTSNAMQFCYFQLHYQQVAMLKNSVVA